MQKLFVRTTTLLAILTLLLPFSAMAQTSRTQGAITGTVTDNTGAPLPGVTVTITSPSLQGSRTEVTDADGKYTIPALPPGEYRAEFTLSGVKNQVREGIRVHATVVTSANAQMSLAVAETVTVTASQVVVDPTQAATQHTMDEEHLKYTAVGSANRSYQSVLSQAPGVSTGGGNPQVMGANIGMNDWYIDGVNSTDPVTHTFGGNMAFDAIQEITLITFGKDAEYKSSGGTVNVITKSGGNDFSGSFDYRYNDPDFLEQGKEKRFAAPSFFGGPVGAASLRFDKNNVTDKSEQPQATLGGPIMRDKLWFFVATHRPETSRTNPPTQGFQPGPRTFTGWNTHGKLTFTPWANHTLTGKFTDSHARIAHSQNSSFFRPEADSQQTQHSWIYAGAYDAVLSSKWLASFQYAHRPASLASFPMSGDIETPGVIDSATSIRSVNFTNNQGRTSERNELIASTTYYMEKFGTHAFKVGVNLDHNEFTSFNDSTGNPALVPNFDAARFCSPNFTYTIAGQPFNLPAGVQCGAFLRTNFNAGGSVGITTRLVMSLRAPATTKEADMRSFYAQDEWRPIPRLTARIGVRYDQTTWGSSNGNPIPDFELWQPRVGLAYDVFNNAATVVHAYGGKIGDENQLTLPSYATRVPSATLNFNLVNGVWTYTPTGSSASVSGHEVASDLKPTFSNQYSLGVTQRVFRHTSIDVTAEYRSQKNIFEDYCGTTAFELPDCFQTNYPLRELPGNLPNPLKSDYRALITKIESRPYNWLDFVFSYTRAKSRGSVEYTQNAGGDMDYYPVHFTNAYGYLTDDARDRIKFNGYAHLPWDFTLGASWIWDSGLAYSVIRSPAPLAGYGTQYLEPRGSRRHPHFHQVDMQLQKDFNIGRFSFGLIGSVFNVMNKETRTGIQNNAGTRAISDPNDPTKIFVDPNQQTGAARFSANFLQPTSWQRPRRYEVGVRFEF